MEIRDGKGQGEKQLYSFGGCTEHIYFLNDDVSYALIVIKDQVRPPFLRVTFPVVAIELLRHGFQWRMLLYRLGSVKHSGSASHREWVGCFEQQQQSVKK